MTTHDTTPESDAAVPGAPWHLDSYNRFLADSLPALLAENVPLHAYAQHSVTPTVRRVVFVIGEPSCGVELDFPGIPCPNEDGVFALDSGPRVVVPVASSADLCQSDIACVGDLLLAYIRDRLGHAPPDLQWDDALAGTWIPLDGWVTAFLRTHPSSQPLDQRNWLAAKTHTRRLRVPGPDGVLGPGGHGLVCPLETPEGPTFGKVVSVARGAQIRGARLMATSDAPPDRLGVAAAMVPFLEHNEPIRQLMGVNMMRQWLPQPDPEPACVVTGYEPPNHAAWCGRNLLTAFLAWGGATHEDSIVLSESCARRLSTVAPVEIGDKLSNRHGTKGVVGAILPDSRMPHLPDNTPVELVYNFIGIHARANVGQVRECVAGRIAHALRRPFRAAPFAAPSSEELHRMLREAGLPEDGMERLRAGRDGPVLQYRSTVGWIYWGCLEHTARRALHYTVGEVDEPEPVAAAEPTPDGDAGTRRGGHLKGRCQKQGDFEHLLLRDAEAYATWREHFRLRAWEDRQSHGLAQRIAEGRDLAVEGASPTFEELERRLAAVGIRSDLREDGLHFAFAPPPDPRLELAAPVHHPWHPGRELQQVGIVGGIDALAPLREANARLAALLGRTAPEALIRPAVEALRVSARRYLNALVTPYLLRPSASCIFSGRAVISQGADLDYDQVALPDEMAWGLFGPFAEREGVPRSEIENRTARAESVLDRVLADAWVLVNRAPTLMATSIVALRPVRRPGRTIRLAPMVLPLLNGDHDGDQVAVFVVLTDEARREAESLLSVAGHLARDPAVLDMVAPRHEALWALAWLSLQPGGRERLDETLGRRLDLPEGYVTRPDLVRALSTMLAESGPTAALTAAERLERLGFEIVGGLGASVAPFLEEAVALPAPALDPTVHTWADYADAVLEVVLGMHSYGDSSLGPQLLAVRSRARGTVRHLSLILGFRELVASAAGELTLVRHGLAEGVTPDDYAALAPGALRGLSNAQAEFLATCRAWPASRRLSSFHVLARAMRARRPGIVFAHAAAREEVDPLVDIDARLLTGLDP